MLQIVTADGVAEQDVLAAIRNRAAEAGAQIQATVLEMMERVRREGFAAVEAYSLQLDGAAPREVTKAEWDAAVSRCPKELYDALSRAARNIRDYQEKLLQKTQIWTSPDGGTVGCLVRGLSRVGIYVPGGKAAYPSSVLMNAIPAKVAGVEEIIMVTPPTTHLSDAVLTAAKIAGVDRVFAVGGVQAIAGLTYGTGILPKVDKLVGPGNAYVATAKRMAYGRLDIDMVAGPSEILVIADETADPKYVAADLLSQAEHDTMASAILLTDSVPLAQKVNMEIARQMGYLDRTEIMEQSLRDFGVIIVCPSLEKAVDLANEIAPEHLEVLTKTPDALLPKLKHAGAIFLGAYSPEPLGDYMAGPDHVLPTSGTARFFSPLSVESFLKRTSLISYDRDALSKAKESILTLSQAEGLSAHANSIAVRFE
jgi:histidinol dehydrogenase